MENMADIDLTKKLPQAVLQRWLYHFTLPPTMYKGSIVPHPHQQPFHL